MIRNSEDKLSGVGPKVSEKLNELGIFSIQDLLLYYPRRYEDTTNIIHIGDLKLTSAPQTTSGKVMSVKEVYTRTRKHLTITVIEDSTGKLTLTWFNQRYLARQIKKGDQLLVHGRVDKETIKKFYPSLYEVIDDTSFPDTIGTIIPLYHENSEISTKQIRRIFKQNQIRLRKEIDKAREVLPEKILEEEKLLPINTTLSELHFPKSKESLEEARKRMAFEEIYNVLRKLKQRNSGRRKSTRIIFDRTLLDSFIKNLPYTPTQAQMRSIKEIAQDMERDAPMYRLLEGDVGSGKTLVAMIAMLSCAKAGYQSILLAPTQVLARQHYDTFIETMPWLKDEVTLVTGATKKTNDGKSLITIGTHAVISRPEILAEKIGLIIVDEQHRFGVKQKETIQKLTLREKGSCPHTLLMSATPIPQSLALAMFGEIEVSILDELPKGRIPIETFITPEEKRAKAYEWIRKKLNDGEQCYVICPIIEESELIEAKAVKKEFAKLKKETFSDFNIGLLYGSMKSEEKLSVLNNFREGKYNLLVTTSVIEVGIDVPNATIMMIEGAERFGLAQLHQLRGRVGRGNKKSYCLLFATEADENEDALARLNYFAKHKNGLDVAEYDLKRRGPGEVYGVKQSGIPKLRFANIMDLELIRRVKKYL